MAWGKYARPRKSLWAVAFFGAVTLAIGVWLGRFSSEQASQRPTPDSEKSTISLSEFERAFLGIVILKNAFDQDILECIKWLRHSTYELHLFRVNAERYASALSLGLPDGYVRYEAALNVIKDCVYEQATLSKTKTFDKMLAHLLEKLKEISETGKRSCNSLVIVKP
jgi:hypothetical protein